MNRYISLLLTVILLATVSCQQDELVSGGTDETVTLTYSVGVDSDDAATRAIGDASQIDELTVEVFENGESVYRIEELQISVNGTVEVPLSLLRGHTYNVVFWAQDKDVTAYNTENLSSITVDYSNYCNSFSAIESLDAFYAVDKNITVEQYNSSISLQRPFAQVNFGNDTDNVPDRVTVTVKNPATVFNPFIGTAQVVEGQQAQTFTFTEGFPEEKLSVNDKEYSYIATTYLFVPANGVQTIANVTIANAGSEKTHDDLVLSLVANTRFNVIGSLVGVQYTHWLEGFAQPKDIHHIATPAELAWWMGTVTKDASVHTDTHENCTIYIDADLDMGGIPMDALDFPDNVTILGQNHTIKNVVLRGQNETETTAYTALLGDVNGLTVSNLTIEGLTLNSSAATGVGALAGKASGTLNFTNIKMQNATVSSSATDNSIAGGLVGYISRKTYNDRSETLQADFTNCTLTSTTVSGAVAGKLVGELSGYDNGEVLNFTNCSATTVTGITSTDFCNVRKSCFIETSLTEDHFLGRETYCRGMVNFNGNRFIPKWDGARKDIVPLVESNVNMIYSPYDVAYYQGKSPASVTFKEDVDLGSHLFAPIYSIKTLDGGSKTVYNLKVDMTWDGNGAAFIQLGGGSTHKNLIFVGADIKTEHDSSIPSPVYGQTNDGGAGNAYAGTLVARVDASYTVENVHAQSGKVYAVCKMGGLVGAVWSNLTMTNCSVDGYTLENYAPGVPNYYALPSPGYMDMYLQQFQDNTATNAALAIMGIHKIPEYGRVNLLQWWYTQGEVGGLIGFVKSPKAVIDGCSVTNTNINCQGQPDKAVVANVWDKKDYDVANPYVSGKAIFAKGNTDIAGRHVNQFIGDVVSARASETGTDYDITISNYTVSGNKYFGVDASSTNSYSHDYASGKYCEVVGCAYYVGVDVGLGDITLKHVEDYAGKLTFYPVGGEANKVVLEEAAGKGNNQTWTGGSFSDMKYEQKNTGKWYSPNWVYNTFSEYPAAP